MLVRTVWKGHTSQRASPGKFAFGTYYVPDLFFCYWSLPAEFRLSRS